MRKGLRIGCLLLAFGLLLGCGGATASQPSVSPEPTFTVQAEPTPVPAEEVVAEVVIEPVQTPVPTLPPTPTPSPTPTPTPTPTPSPTPVPTPFGIAWLPDTQTLAYSYPEKLEALGAEIAARREPDRLVAVLHTGDVVGIDVVCGDAVASLQQVHFFDVEALDGFAVVFDAAAVGHFDAGHPSQDVADDAVTLLLVRRHAVVHGVALLVNLLGAHAHLLQLHGLLTDAEIHALRTVGHGAHLLSDAQSCGCDDERVGRRAEREPIVALRVGVGKVEDRSRCFRSDRHIGIDGTMERVGDVAFDDRLRLHLQSQCVLEQDGC